MHKNSTDKCSLKTSKVLVKRRSVINIINRESNCEIIENL